MDQNLVILRGRFLNLCEPKNFRGPYSVYTIAFIPAILLIKSKLPNRAFLYATWQKGFPENRSTKFSDASSQHFAEEGEKGVVELVGPL